MITNKKKTKKYWDHLMMICLRCNDTIQYDTTKQIMKTKMTVTTANCNNGEDNDKCHTLWQTMISVVHSNKTEFLFYVLLMYAFCHIIDPHTYILSACVSRNTCVARWPAYLSITNYHYLTLMSHPGYLMTSSNHLWLGIFLDSGLPWHHLRVPFRHSRSDLICMPCA